MAVYLDILEAAGPLSLIFEKNLLMSHEISLVVEKTVLNLEDLLDKGLDYAIDSYLAMFFINEEDSLTTVISNYTKVGHKRRKPENRESTEIKIDSFNDATLNQEPLNSALTLRSTSIEIFIALVKNKLGSFRDDIFCSSMWLDPQFWMADCSTNGLKEIKTLIQHFTDPLQATGFEKQKVYAEWCSLQTTTKALFIHLEYQEIWEKIFVYQREEFPNICSLGEFVTCLFVGTMPT